MKTLMFDGRVGANGTEVKTTKNGNKYARFSVANNVYTNGEEKTEWFDVITYDPTFIEKRAQYLTKGSYVIISGSLKTEVRVDNGKIWVNHYVTASTIDTPRFSSNKNSEQNTVSTDTPIVSTYTGGTPSVISVPSEAVAVPSPQVSVVGASHTANFDNETDDLPF